MNSANTSKKTTPWHAMLLNGIYKYGVFVVIFFAFATRLPQLLSENLFLDGDECIVGLMAKHFAEGKAIPWFFYGQSYGFSMVEVFSIRLFYAVFGMNDIAVKLAMLTLWIVGVLFFHKTLKHFETERNKWAPLLITLAFVCMPSLAIWSMKARGGYLTAFLLTSIVIYIISTKPLTKHPFLALLVGLMIVFIYQSQPLWLAGLLPIIGYFTFINVRLKTVALQLLGILMGVMFFSVIKSGLSQFCSPSVVSFTNFNAETLRSIPSFVFGHLTGSYIYSQLIPSAISTRLAAFFYTVLLFATFLVLGARWFKKSSIHPLSFILALSVIANLGYLMLLGEGNYRYLLPLSGYIFLMFFFVYGRSMHQRWVNLTTCLLIVIGSIALYYFKNVSDVAQSSILAMKETLYAEKVHYVFCQSGLIQWQLDFYSNEEIIARYNTRVDRYPEYIQRVNKAFFDPNTDTGVIGHADSELADESEEVITIDYNYFLYKNPSRSILEKRGFEF